MSDHHLMTNEKVEWLELINIEKDEVCGFKTSGSLKEKVREEEVKS